jgi:hypothetical protein
VPSYVYGVVPASAGSPAEAGIGGAEVALFAIDDEVALLHSHLDADSVQPRRAHLTAHDRVLAAAMDGSPVLPLRFGIVAELDPERVRDGLDVPVVLERMRLLDGHAEVQVLWTLDEEAALQRVADAVPAVRDTSLPAVDRGRAVAETMTELAIGDLERVVARLRDHVVDRGAVESRGTASAGVALLVAVEDLDQLAADCDRLASEVAAAGSLRTVAGLPPYTFADLDLDLDLAGV